LSLLVIPVLILILPGTACAHRLEGEYTVLPGRRVQIESWFDLTGDSPRGAVVQVFRADDKLLTEGKLDAKGLFVFAYERAEALRVVISAGAGHVKTLHIRAAELEPRSTAATVNSASSSNPRADPDGEPGDGQPMPRADRSWREPFTNVLVGVGFLLALAAFVLSLRNARQLRALCRNRSDERGDFKA
jgi:hypothetical protein